MYASSGKTILIVDDDHDIRALLLELLSCEGYGVLGAAHGGDALNVLQAGARPDLILLDLTMPVMNGWQFREAQRSDPGFAEIPVVLISATGTDSAASSLEVAELVKKPIDVEQLLAVVERHCQ